MTCQEMADLLVSYAGDELAPPQREFVELHVERCPVCRDRLAELRWAHQRLGVLRQERYQPELSGRIMSAIRRRQTGRLASLWAGRALRLAGGAVAAAAVAMAAVLLLPDALPFVRPAGPDAPSPGTRAFLVVGDDLIHLDVGAKRQIASERMLTGAQTVGGGGSVFVQLGERLQVSSPFSPDPRKVGAVPYGRLIAASPDGRSVYIARSAGPDQFAVDRVDVFTGEVDPDPQPQPGDVLGGAISRDGRYLYLAARVGGNAFLKQFRLSDRQVEYAPSLGEMTDRLTVLPAQDESAVYVVGSGRVVMVPMDPNRPPMGTRDPEITPAAVIAPDGQSLLIARSGGGLMSLDPKLGHAERLDGPLYSHLAWSDGRTWLYAATDGVLEVRHADRPDRVVSKINLPRGAVRSLGPE